MFVFGSIHLQTLQPIICMIRARNIHKFTSLFLNIAYKGDLNLYICTFVLQETRIYDLSVTHTKVQDLRSRI